MIAKYEVINPIIIRNKPYLNYRGELVIPNIASQRYKWYIEVARNNVITNDREYYILFSQHKFDYNCVKLTKDYGGRYVIRPHGEFADYITKEINIRGNVNIEFVECEQDYDTWEIK